MFSIWRNGCITLWRNWIGSIKSFKYYPIYKCNWKGINYWSKIYYWNTFRKKSPAVAVNNFYIKKKTYVQVISQKLIWIVENNSKRWWIVTSFSKKIIKLFTLLIGTTSKHHGEFYCFNCLHSFRTENKLKCYEKVCKNKKFYGFVMPSKKG